jgi:hypothetical protein
MICYRSCVQFTRANAGVNSREQVWEVVMLSPAESLKTIFRRMHPDVEIRFGFGE